MTAVSKKMLEQQPNELEMLLPFHAAGTLSASDARRVEEALARDAELAKQYAVIREEYAATIQLNESLGAPSLHSMQKLFAAIDAEPARQPPPSLTLAAWVTEFFGRLSPRTLAWSAGVGALALLVQAGVISAMLVSNQTVAYQTASLSKNEPTTGDLAAAPPQALVRFAPDARVADITALLESYRASIVDGVKGGMFRLKFGDKPLAKSEVTDLMNRLQREKIISLAVLAQ